MKRKKIIFILLGVVAAILIAIYFVTGSSSSNELMLKSSAVQKSDIEVSVSATGTVQAIQTVEVGTQVSGVIDKLYVDFNTEVTSGQLLAVLDTKPLQISLTQAGANLESAKAELDYQEICFNREKELYEKGVSTKSTFDEATYNYTRARASYTTALAEYNKASTNLNYAYIKSPIDGIILERAVEKGQTVAASFSTPTLFTIVNDLTKMQVEANIDEADIGSIKPGQAVNFTVDAYPDDIFEGEVSEVRLNPEVNSNVVTYIVIISAPNPDKKLMPGMTASIEIVIESAKNVTCVPVEALQFSVDNSQYETYLAGLSNNDRSKMEENVNTFKTEMAGKQVLWIKDGNIMYAIPVETGINDGILCEIKSEFPMGALEVVSGFTQLSEMPAQEEEESGSSPFMPTPPKR